MDTYWLLDKSYNREKGGDTRIPGQPSSQSDPPTTPSKGEDLSSGAFSPIRQRMYMSKQAKDEVSLKRTSSTSPIQDNAEDGGESKK